MVRRLWGWLRKKWGKRTARPHPPGPLSRGARGREATADGYPIPLGPAPQGGAGETADGGGTADSTPDASSLEFFAEGRGTTEADGDLTPPSPAPHGGEGETADGVQGGRGERLTRQLAVLRQQLETLEALAALAEGEDEEARGAANAGGEAALDKAQETIRVRPGRPQSLMGQRQPVTERGNMWEGVL